ncbi:MAG: peptide deformylase [Erysipelotrichaceae bacterium]
MIRTIVKDTFFLSQKAVPATKDDIPTGLDLIDTLVANKDRCVGMAANMIGVNKAIIIVNMGFNNIVMFNPRVLNRSGEYETQEGCLSLSGVRKTKRYKEIEIEYTDMNWQKKKIRLSGFYAQTAQHELDHLNGILI